MDARPSRPFLALAAVLLVVALAACSAAPAATSSPAPATAVPTAALTAVTPTVAATMAPTEAPLFPVELADDEDGSATIPAEPTKIVSLTPAATETLFELGITYAEQARARGITHYRVAPALNSHPRFIAALKSLVLNAVPAS